MDLDSSLPQAVCQLLAHVTRDKDVRDYFENCGGVHRLITTIPSFEGEIFFPIICIFTFISTSTLNFIYSFS